MIERGKNNREYSDSYIALWMSMCFSLSARVPQRENIGRHWLEPRDESMWSIWQECANP